MPLIELKKISRIYETGETTVRALQNIQLQLDAQAFISFVGPSGSGKTTLLNVIGCLDKPTEGEVVINGTQVNGFNSREAAQFRGENIGFIFQNFNLLPVLTVFENIEYPLVMVQNVAEKERRERVLRLLEAVGMLDQKDKFPSQVSGGQKQRIAVARALVTNPKLVLADEPTANLDSVSAHNVIELMRKMQHELKTTFIFSTHDPKVVREAEIVYTLEDGQITNRKNQAEAVN
ncbi:MAG: ABC transporter ATP-binding protein [Calditrichaeota bacterium]|nr:MAG: ABC transporter ATP-binding protein [Calditrichota bacterium]